jgi:hypothetical protein
MPLIHYLLDELLNRIELNKLIPNACQNVILVKPKITGISQFQSHIVGKAKINAKMHTTNIAPIIVKNFSIYNFDLFV